MSEQGHCTMKMWYLWSYYSDHSGWSGKSESPEMAHRNHHYHNSVWEHARTLCSMVAWLIVIIIREYVITLYSLPKGKHSFKVPFFFPPDLLKTASLIWIQTWIFKCLSHKLGCTPLFSFDVFQMDGNYLVFSAGQLGDTTFLLNVQHHISYISEYKPFSVSHLKWECSFYLLGILFVLGICWYLWNQYAIWYQCI